MDKQLSTKRSPPTSIRFSDKQKDELIRRATKSGLSISGYIKLTALNQSPRKLRQPTIDRKLLAQVLAHLGRVGNNLNQLSRTLNRGRSIEIVELQQALIHHEHMHVMIMIALGYRDKSLKHEFNKNGSHRDY